MEFSKSWLAIILFSLHTFYSVQASPIQKAKRTAIDSTYDFIIIGGGTAGLTVANRLSEVSSFSVLVVESGQYPEIVSAYSTPGASQSVLGTTLDWAFVTPAQESLSNRTITYHRGRGVGGSSLINGLTYGRGSSTIYDLWEHLGNNGWSWHDVFPYFKKSTSFVPLEVAPFQTYNASAYSEEGPVKLSYPQYVYPASTAFIEALDAVGVTTVTDLNSGNNIGTKQEPLTLDSHQQRSSAYDAYYKPVRNRTNLSLLANTPVRQINFETRNGSLTATGIVVTDQFTGQTRNITARKEVILTAGTFQSPQILMLSGVGPQATLDRFGIAPFLINENIGQHLQDHTYFSVIAKAQTSQSASQLYNRVDLLQAAEMQYSANMSGPLTTPVGPTYGFQQLPADVLESLDSTSQLQNRKSQAHIEYLWENIYYPTVISDAIAQYPPKLNESFFSVTAALLAPASRGNVTLQTNNIQDGPSIYLNYLSDETDQKIALHAFRNLRKILAQPKLASYTTGSGNREVVPGIDVVDDDTLLSYIKSTLLPVWHPVGTCRMLPANEGGVVDSRLRLYGARGLRVIDASIMPVIPDQHIQGPVYMIAEKGAEMIKEDYNV